MLSRPRLGDRVQIWYRESLRSLPYHGQTGIVVIVSRRRPRNHGVEIGGRLVVVPAGNIRKYAIGHKE